jgi:1-acyl-sn-glycerol-3-phosphate acyltransferase
VLWPKHGIMRKRGVAVVEFLPTIPPGLPNAEFMTRLEHEVETASDALMAEAGFRG